MKRKHLIATMVGITLAAVAALSIGTDDSPWHPPVTGAVVAVTPADSPWFPAH